MLEDLYEGVIFINEVENWINYCFKEISIIVVIYFDYVDKLKLIRKENIMRFWVSVKWWRFVY